MKPNHHLLNRDFASPPALCSPEEADPAKHCILEKLCERHQGVFIDVKSINIYHFRPFLLQLAKYNHLQLKPWVDFDLVIF